MKEKGHSIQVLERMASLLDAVVLHDNDASLKVLSAETGLHPSTAFRILSSLTEIGFVERTTGGHYQLGVKLLQLGGRVAAQVDIRREALPIMEALRDQVGETVNLTVREGDELVYIERSIAKRIMRVEQVIGSRAPLHVTAVGKLMLAELGEAACHRYAQRCGLPGYTGNTVTDVEDLIRISRLSLEQGYSFDNQEADAGVGCIGVLIRDASGGVIAGLSISAPIERRQDAWIPLLVAAGQRLSARCGYQGK